ncbi:MAG: ATP-dependent helicase HrpB [Candidatus Latescibacterota bacterium]|jgi:ATP-dependent helicase HrpB
MLPVLAVESRIVSCLRQANRLVLTAPTGSGKTTQVPRILLRAELVPGQIVVLQPRRLATRLVAQHVARELGQPLGGLVGYQTRHDSQVSAATRLRFVTEGLFLRLVQSDPVLTGIGTVILDEFHERSLAADTALGLVRQLQEQQRPELRLVVMSATLDAEAVATALDCPLIEAHGRIYPVEVEYAPGSPTAPPWERAVTALRLLLSRQPTGDVLVFMPGAYEIRRTIEAAEQALRGFPEPLAFFPLHGSLSAAAQDAAVAPSPRRKVIVATNVAETSITIEGVGHVIDAGLARVHRHDPRRGIDVLLVESTSRASAEQRAGRAGRTRPGTCVRLWSSAEHQARPERDLPEIQRLDLAEAVLQLRALGIDEPLALPWLEPPAAPAVARATALLTDLGALDSTGRLTATGRQMALFPTHPRISRLLVEAAARQCLDRAAVWAALIGEREVLSQPLVAEFTRIPDDPWPSDLAVRERALERARELRYDPGACAAAGIQANACRELERTADLYRDAARRAGLSVRRRGRTENLLKSLLVAFFDRVALRRGQDTRLCAMAGQRRVELDSRSVARECTTLVALEVRELEAVGGGVRTVLSLASAIDPEWLAEVHPSRVTVRTEVVWNAETRAAEGARTREYDGLVLEQQTGGPADPAAAAELLVDRIRAGELHLEGWDEQVEQWILRTRFVAGLFPERGLIRYEEDERAVILHEIVTGATRYSQIRSRPCLSAVQQALSWADQQFVEQMAPTQVRLPSGRRLRIDYGADGPPRGRARIQDLYDLTETPRLAGGRQPVLLEILGPNHRPVQVTDDLAGFWAKTYPEVRQELKRRYPRHEWR